MKVCALIFFIAVLYFHTLLNCIIQVSVVSALQSNLLDLICSSVTLCYLIKVWLRLINKSANFSSTLYASFADHHNFLMILDPNTYYYFRSLLFYQGFFYLICVTLLILYGYDNSPSEVRSFAKFMQYFFVILRMHKKLWFITLYAIITDYLFMYITVL